MHIAQAGVPVVPPTHKCAMKVFLIPELQRQQEVAKPQQQRFAARKWIRWISQPDHQDAHLVGAYPAKALRNLLRHPSWDVSSWTSNTTVLHWDQGFHSIQTWLYSSVKRI